MTDLFSVNGTAIDKSVKGLSEDRIEGFVHLNVGCGGAHCEGNDILHSFDWIECFCGSFKMKGSVDI